MAAPAAPRPAKQRLAELVELQESGLVTDEEYARARKTILQEAFATVVPLPAHAPIGGASSTAVASGAATTAGSGAAAAAELSLKAKATKIQFELALDPNTGIKETLRQANEYFGIVAEGTPNQQASAVLVEMGL